MRDPRDFLPDWASPPGATISDILLQNRTEPSELARQLGQSPATVRDLIDGTARISPETAIGLARTLGASPEFWLARDERYQAALQRVGAQWVEDVPVDDMIKFGWIAPPLKEGTIATLLRYFRMPSVADWKANYGSLVQEVAFRMSPSFVSHPAAVAAWLRQGEIEAEAILCRPWDPQAFIGAFPRIRELTRLRNPDHFLPKLQGYCAECGVAVVIVRAPDGCRASGAARFLSKSQGLIQLSFRYLTDDHFWFTFFHEAGHLVLHGDKGLYLEGLEPKFPKDEKEANRFAAHNLVPEHLQPELRSLHASTFEILRFASKAGLAPGIVVGQLQHLGLVPPNYLNRLKRRFQWEASGAVQPRKGT
jgi:HTH-type transcriptional regulator / antitoxin HigA